MKKVLFALPGVAAMSAFASTSTEAQDYNPDITVGTDAFNLSTPAAVAIGIVCAVAGVRVFIKLINRGAGK